MAIETLNANGVSGWLGAIPASSNDTYATTTTEDAQAIFNLADTGLTDSAIVNSITVKIESSYTGAGNNCIDLRQLEHIHHHIFFLHPVAGSDSYIFLFR